MVDLNKDGVTASHPTAIPTPFVNKGDNVI